MTNRQVTPRLLRILESKFIDYLLNVIGVGLVINLLSNVIAAWLDRDDKLDAIILVLRFAIYALFLLAVFIYHRLRDHLRTEYNKSRDVKLKELEDPMKIKRIESIYAKNEIPKDLEDDLVVTQDQYKAEPQNNDFSDHFKSTLRQDESPNDLEEDLIEKRDQYLVKLKNNDLSDQQIKEKLISRLEDNDLKAICFDLGINYQDLSGDTFSVKLMSLIQHLRKRERTNDLINWVKKNRSDITF